MPPGPKDCWSQQAAPQALLSSVQCHARPLVLSIDFADFPASRRLPPDASLATRMLFFVRLPPMEAYGEVHFRGWFPGRPAKWAFAGEAENPPSSSTAEMSLDRSPTYRRRPVNKSAVLLARLETALVSGRTLHSHRANRRWADPFTRVARGAGPLLCPVGSGSFVFFRPVESWSAGVRRQPVANGR